MNAQIRVPRVGAHRRVATGYTAIVRFAITWFVVCGFGCYGPSYKDCEVTCATGNGCPSGLTCDDALGVCRTEGHGVACGTTNEDSAGDGGIDALPDAQAGACDVRSIEASGSHACALGGNGKVHCWGDNLLGANGSMGAGTCTGPTGGSQPCYVEPQIVPLPMSATLIGAGDRHACAKLMDQSLWCWGDNSAYQFGNGTSNVTGQPPTNTNRPDASVIVAGQNHTCTVVGNNVLCSGKNSLGEAGSGGQIPQPSPFQVPINVGSEAGAIASGFNHVCAVDGAANSIRCWGSNANQQIAPGTQPAYFTPTPIPGQQGGTMVAAGRRHTCTLDLSTLRPRCHGDNSAGQLGTGDTNPPADPFGGNVVAINGVMAMRAGGDQTCVILTDKSVSCWGSADGTAATTHPVPTAVPLPPGRAATSITVGGTFACALLDDRSVYCWGANNLGQHGDGTTTGNSGSLARVCQ